MKTSVCLSHLPDACRLIANYEYSLDTDIDGQPSIFRDRYIKAGGRCYAVRHGVDDIGRLGGSRAGRSHTVLDPDCSVNREIVSEILDLPDVN